MTKGKSPLLICTECAYLLFPPFSSFWKKLDFLKVSTSLILLLTLSLHYMTLIMMLVRCVLWLAYDWRNSKEIVGSTLICLLARMR